jgi:PKD repeat protein
MEGQLPGPTTIPASFQVNVTGSPQAFTVNVTTNAVFSGGIIGTTANLTAVVAYATGYPAVARSTLFGYTFIFGDGTSTSFQTNRLVGSAIHTFASAPTSPVIVVVQELSSNSLAKIKETGFLIPTGSFAFSPNTPTSGQILSFTATGSGGQPPYTYAWDFGDGAKTTGSSATHSYSTSGNYTVTLTVTDYWGHKFTSTQAVTVTSASTTTNSNAFYEEVGGGIAAVVVAAIAGLLIVRRRRKTATSVATSPTAPSSR